MAGQRLSNKVFKALKSAACDSFSGKRGVRRPLGKRRVRIGAVNQRRAANRQTAICAPNVRLSAPAPLRENDEPRRTRQRSYEARGPVEGRFHDISRRQAVSTGVRRRVCR